MNNNEKLVLFIYFDNSCIIYGDHLILLIKIGKIHKERMLSQDIIDAFKKREKGEIETQLKMIVAAKWWLFSQLQK